MKNSDIKIIKMDGITIVEKDGNRGIVIGYMDGGEWIVSWYDLESVDPKTVKVVSK